VAHLDAVETTPWSNQGSLKYEMEAKEFKIAKLQPTREE
jgi:hypothetical protein